jgi:hypothetical protein
MALASYFREHNSDTSVFAIPQIGLNKPRKTLETIIIQSDEEVPNITLMVVMHRHPMMRGGFLILLIE